VILRNALSGRLPSFESLRPGWILTTGSLIITTVLWIAGRLVDEIPTDFWLWRALSQLTILWSVTLMAIAMLSVVCAHALEPVFGGLDRSVRFHRILGPKSSNSASRQSQAETRLRSGLSTGRIKIVDGNSKAIIGFSLTLLASTMLHFR
jgi:hypothetical protein